MWRCTITQPGSPASLCLHALIMIVYGRIVLFFISLLGLNFVSGFIHYFVLLCWDGLMSLCNWCAGECVFQRVSVCMCVWERQTRSRLGVFSGSVSALIIVPVCSGVPLPLHPFIQMTRERDNGRWRWRGGRRPFPSGGKIKTQMRKRYFWKKDIFLLSGVTKKSVHF